MAPSSLGERSAAPSLLLALVSALLVVLIVSGVALALLHRAPNIPFSLLVRMHIWAGILFVPLGVIYLATHTLRIGAPWSFVPWLLLWVIGVFGLFFLQVPFQAATVIGTFFGGLLAAWLWWRAPRKYAWQSYASAIGVMLALGAVIDTGYVMAMPWTSMRSTFFHWTHLALTPLVPVSMYIHARAARRRRNRSVAAFRMPLWWYKAVAVLIAVQAGWVVYRSIVLARAVPQAAYGAGSEAKIQMVKDTVSVSGELASAMLQSSHSCGKSGCHLGPYRQWHGSAHRFASLTIPYLRAAEAFVARRGKAAEAFCASCHNPLAVATGAYARRDWTAVTAFARDGVNCEACHLRVPPPPELGRFSAYSRTFPDTPFPWLAKRADLDALRRSYLDADSYFHRQKYFDPYLHTADMCGACHAERHVDLSGNEIVMFDHLEGLRRSGLEAQGITCQKCHNNLDAYEHLEESSEHARPDHVFPGVALDLPEAIAPDAIRKEPFLAQDLRETADFLRAFLDGEHKVPDYERKYLHLIGDKRINAFEAYIEHRRVLDMSVQTVATPNSLRLRITSSNNKAGHDFPSGPPDLSEYWLEVAVRPVGGEWRTVIGHDAANGAIDARAPRLGGRVWDVDGAELREHAIDRVGRVELWNIPFGKSVLHEVQLRADEVPRPGEIRAEWRYRRYNPQFSRWAWGDETKLFPAHALASVEVAVP